MKKIALSLTVIASLFASCTKENVDDTDKVTAPETYTFTRNGVSTVSFSGQTTRLAMASELASALKDPTKTKEELDGMFAHSEGNQDFSDDSLNASSKSVRSKTAASNDYFSANTTQSNVIKADFDNLIAEQVSSVFPNWEQTAVAGSAGQLQEAGGGSIRYVNAKGLELNQALAKGLIGGMIADQMLNNYLSPSVLDAGSNRDNNDNDVVKEGKSYTTMEHKWDEAFGYLYGAESNPASPALGADSFLNKYLKRVDGDEDFAGVADTIFEAFKLGRAAIVAKDYELRDAQAELIREAVSTVIAVRAVYYLQGGKKALESSTVDYAVAFHDLSEGIGFVYSLQFTRQPNSTQPYFTHEEVNAFMDTLMEANGLWDVTPATLDSMSEEIANRFGFSVEAAAN